MFFALLKGEAVGFVVSSDHGRNRGILPHVHGRALLPARYFILWEQGGPRMGLLPSSPQNATGKRGRAA